MNALDGLARSALDLLSQASWRGGILLALAVLAGVLLRRRSAATRHVLWGAALIGVLAVPLLAPFLPSWSVHVLPAPVAAPAVDAPEPSAARSVDVTTATPAPSTPAPFPWAALFVGVWAVGALVSLARVAGSHVRLGRLLAAARPVADTRWRAELEAIARALGLERDVALVRSATAAVPLACGLMRATVVVPSHCDRWSDDTRRAVLVHELAHVRRGDLAWRLFARLVRALLWFHPLVHYAVHELELESEKACDDAALESGERPSGYAGALLSLASVAVEREPAAALALVRRSGLVARIEAVVARGRDRRPPGSVARVLIGTIATIAVAVLAASRLVPVTVAAVAPPTLATRDADDAGDATWIEARLVNAPEGPVTIHSARARWRDLGDAKARVDVPHVTVTNWSSGRIVAVRLALEVPGTTRDQMWLDTKIDSRATAVLRLAPEQWSVETPSARAERLTVSITGVRYEGGRMWASGDDAPAAGAQAPTGEPSEQASPRVQRMASPPAEPRPQDEAAPPTPQVWPDATPTVPPAAPVAPVDATPGAGVPPPLVTPAPPAPPAPRPRAAKPAPPAEVAGDPQVTNAPGDPVEIVAVKVTTKWIPESGRTHVGWPKFRLRNRTSRAIHSVSLSMTTNPDNNATTTVTDVFPAWGTLSFKSSAELDGTAGDLQIRLVGVEFADGTAWGHPTLRSTTTTRTSSEGE